jgi:ABC-type sulfate/molybdate transport systems ATPase subunit
MGRAIVRDPAAFLMDEPLSNLDAKLRVQMRTEVSRIQQRLGTTTVYVTHDQTEAMTLGDRVAVMRDGRIVALGDAFAVGVGLAFGFAVGVGVSSAEGAGVRCRKGVEAASCARTRAAATKSAVAKTSKRMVSFSGKISKRDASARPSAGSRAIHLLRENAARKAKG